MKTESSLPATERLNLIGQFSNILLLAGVVLALLGSGIWFNLGVLSVILGILGLFGVAIAKRDNWHTLIERLMMLGMLIGIVGMFQASYIQLYEYGFYSLALSTVGFIVILHVPKPQEA